MIAVFKTDLICSVSCLLNQLSYAVYILGDIAYWHQLLVDTLNLAEQIWKLVCQFFYCNGKKSTSLRVEWRRKTYRIMGYEYIIEKQQGDNRTVFIRIMEIMMRIMNNREESGLCASPQVACPSALLEGEYQHM